MLLILCKSSTPALAKCLYHGIVLGVFPCVLFFTLCFLAYLLEPHEMLDGWLRQNLALCSRNNTKQIIHSSF